MGGYFKVLKVPSVLPLKVEFKATVNIAWESLPGVPIARHCASIFSTWPVGDQVKLHWPPWQRDAGWQVTAAQVAAGS